MSEEDDLKVTALYQQSRQEQPTAELDRQIHNAASRAIRQKSQHWFWRFSTAAVVLLSFSVVLNLLINEMDSPDALVEEYVLPESGVRDRAAAPSAEEEAAAEVPSTPKFDFYSLPEAQAPAPAPSAMRKEKKLGAEPMLQQRMLDEDVAIGSSAGDSSRASLQIPQLPVDLPGLLDMGADLKGVERADGTINLYHRDKLILRVRTETDSVDYMAWPGSEILGVRVNWSYKPTSFNRCSQPIPYRRCELSGAVDGFFEGERLDHIRWSRQAGE